MRLRRAIGACFLLFGTGLLAAAGMILMRQAREETDASRRAEDLLPLVQQAVRAEQGVPLDTEIAEQPASETNAMLPAAQVNGIDCAGVIEFPTLGLILPVLADCTEELLETAPCRQYGTAAGEDLVIAGHNYRRHFKRLRELEVGDKVVFTDMVGTQHTYTVAYFETLLPDDLDRMLAGDWPLSLYTCTSGGEKRLTVRCVRDSGE